MKKMMRRLRKSEAGQTATEYMLIISVIVLGLVGAASVFIPQFNQAVGGLAGQVVGIFSSTQQAAQDTIQQNQI